MVSRDEAGLRQGLTDALAARVTDSEGAAFSESERAVLDALPLLGARTAERAIALLKEHFDQGGKHGEIGQIVYAYGMYRGLHATLAALGARILDAEGRPLEAAAGFGVVTTDDGAFIPRDEIEFP